MLTTVIYAKVQFPENRLTMSKKSNKTSLTIGDGHKGMEVQIQNQCRLVIAIYNKHLLDSGFDSATILLDVNDIKQLRNKCNAALDSCEPLSSPNRST